ncbi:cell division protein FtsQ/DivIB [Pendulispora albinea]|uniref:Cell division protein FtsQ n=1 Tax=Pendulispora albinea TaxID=2741071 RepID=A0ABZ2M1E1_9BACT
MNPTNRRVGKPQLLPDVMDMHAHEEGGGEEGAALPSTGEPAGRGAGESLGGAGSPAAAGGKRAPGPAMRALQAVLGFALVVGVSVSVAWAARHYVTHSPRFAVSEIEVRGAKMRPSEALAEEAGIAKGQNVFSVDLDEARARLGKDPWVREVTLARRLPGTVIIQVAEREAVAIVALGDLYLASHTGEIFKRIEPGDPSDLPIITGITPEAVADDRDGVAQSIRRALDLAGDYEHGPLAQRARLQEIHLARDGSTTLVVGGKSPIQLSLGEPPFRKKLDQAVRVMAELDRRGAKAEAIMLDNDTRPDRVVVRMR